jgi:hypothetical protein
MLETDILTEMKTFFEDDNWYGKYYKKLRRSDWIYLKGIINNMTELSESEMNRATVRASHFSSPNRSSVIELLLVYIQRKIGNRGGL